MKMILKLASIEDISTIWNILQQAIERRKADGSKQWQDGYPNPEVILSDIEKCVGYKLEKDNEIIGYCAIIINDEPVYAELDGEWLSNGDFIVYHRVAIADEHNGKGYAKAMFKLIEDVALEKGIKSLKVDTNFDNHAMLHLLKTQGYTYCGKVFFRDSERLAFEKLIEQ